MGVRACVYVYDCMRMSCIESAKCQVPNAKCQMLGASIDEVLRCPAYQELVSPL